MYEQSFVAVKNIHLAIMKQGKIVSALGNISNVLSFGLRGHTESPPKTSTPPPLNDASYNYKIYNIG